MSPRVSPSIADNHNRALIGVQQLKLVRFPINTKPPPLEIARAAQQRYGNNLSPKHDVQNGKKFNGIQEKEAEILCKISKKLWHSCNNMLKTYNLNT
jgi:hypothetical protein